MTKVLIISNKFDLTADFIVQRLREKNTSFYRFNTEELTHSVSISLDFSSDSFRLFDATINESFELKDFSAVYFRRPEIPLFDFQNLTTGEVRFLRNEILFLLEGVYKILRCAYWVSPLYAIREAENKVYQLEVAQALEFDIPESLISNSYITSKSFYKRNRGECIIKPIKSGLVDDADSTAIFTSQLTQFPASEAQVECFPSFIQRHVEKEADVRVICVGNNVFATLIHSQSHTSTKIDWRKGQVMLEHTSIDIPVALKEKCITRNFSRFLK